MPVLVSQSEVYYKVDRLLAGLTSQQIGTTARWYSNKTPLCPITVDWTPNLASDFICVFIDVLCFRWVVDIEV